jgi:tRNA pseudouridine38-40 synthase
MPNSNNHKLTLSYDGRAYFGWQRHGNKPTIQGALEDALSQVFGQMVRVTGAGRTDRGAHAEGQVASCELPTQLEGGQPATPEAIEAALNAALSADIRVSAVERVDPTFHARSSATGKRYRYEIHRGSGECPAELSGRVWWVKTPLDVTAMRRCCDVLRGEHDFCSFATRSNFVPTSTVRQLRVLELEGDAAPRLTVLLEADSFLYKMVRNIVRALVKVGEGRSDRAKLAQILAARDRQAAPGTAPASGLYLDRVFY